MALPYPYELRIRALGLIEKGLSITRVKELLNISRQTLHQWKNIKKQEGDIKPKQGYQKGHSKKITNILELRELVDNNSDKSLKELAALSNKYSATTIWRGIKTIGFSYKKNFYAPKKGRWIKE